jgi:hypothetical protein
VDLGRLGLILIACLYSIAASTNLPSHTEPCQERNRTPESLSRDCRWLSAEADALLSAALNALSGLLILSPFA